MRLNEQASDERIHKLRHIMMTTTTGWNIGLITLLLLGTAVGAVRAQASGPVQSEFAAPGGGGGGAHVDEFTGAFGFDIPLLRVPGPQGSGFDVTMSYHSGAPINQDVSWVGYGWSLNAGAIVRDRRGLPDDWQDTVLYWTKLPRVFSVSATRNVNLEITSSDYNQLLNLDVDPKNPTSGKVSMSLTTAFNNRTGFTHSFSIGAWAKGLMDLNFTSNEDGNHFRASIDPHDVVHGLQKCGLGDGYALLANGLITLHGTVQNVRALFKAPEQHPPSAARAPVKGGASDYSATFLLNALPWFLNGIEVGASGNYRWSQSDPSWKRLGVGYMYSWRAGASDVMDYYSERDRDYKNNDMFLPIPLTNADNFIVLGGGTGGSFRMFNHGVGTFHPNTASTSISIDQVGADFHAGTRFGVGAHLGLGHSGYDLSQWGLPAVDNPAYRFEGTGDQSPYVFRFHNDLGGKVEFAANDDATRADITSSGPGGILKTPAVPLSIDPMMNNGDFWGSAVFVGHHTNGEMMQKTDKGIYYNSYTKDPSTRSFVSRFDPKLKDQIGEYCVVNKEGTRFVYGLPVYARNEKTISLGLGNTIRDSSTGSIDRISYGDIVYRYTSTDTAETVRGEEHNAPYATTYLLTEITTPDYVDRTNNGPTPDDFGGYTKFNYVAAAGYNLDYLLLLPPGGGPYSFTAPWFKWRTPYHGLYYGRGDLSDYMDNVGSFASGEKQVYYLQSIETKTHIAYFVTNKTNTLVNGHRIKGSQAERQDGYQAYHPSATTSAAVPAIERRDAGDSTVSAAEYTTSGTPHPVANISRRLERIELYAKDSSGRAGELLTTVFMDYDYSLRRGMPNSVRPAATPTTATRSGMLTLTKLWWQGSNVVNYDYSPYLFGYANKRNTEYPTAIRTQYPGITHYADTVPAALENPDYSVHDVDRWGNYQYNGAARSAILNPWVNQKPDSSKFDPAAWQLKWIKTPSQAEVQVQYEQNSYSYVQNRPAMAMVSLLTETSDHVLSDDGGDPPKYLLNLATLGIPDTAQYAMKRLKSLITRTFIDVPAGGVKERVYFKLLYALPNGTTPSLNDNQRKSEYIDGYAELADVGVEAISGTSPTKYRMYVKLKSGDEVPRQVCREFVRKNRRGLMGEHDDIEDNGNSLSMVTSLLFKFPSFDEEQYCLAIDYPNSYVRLPMLYPKRGGGIRVKRLLTLDRGLENDPTLTGAEYIYEDYDETRHEIVGSGVAANEPTMGREENALVTIGPGADKPELASHIIAGVEKAQYEGPLGESLLPAAGVGYSRVVMRNIHSGVSSPGFAVTRTYTAKDYPFLMQYPGIGKSVDYTDMSSKSFQLLPIVSGLVAAMLPIRVYEDDLWLTQGYRFILNDMHGRFRSRATYSGDYKWGSHVDTLAMTSLQEVNYFAPGEKIPMLQSIGDTIRLDNPGKEMEVAMESRATVNNVLDGNVEGDLSVQSFIPFDIQPTGQARLETTRSSLATHVMSKVVSYPAVARGTVSYADGIYHYTRYEAFDKLSGDPVIVHTTDGYDRLALEQETGGQNGAYHLHNFPATGQYPAMGQKATNEHQLLKSTGGLTITKYVVTGVHELIITGSDPHSLCEARMKFRQGDLVRLRLHSDTTQYRGFYHVDSAIVGNDLEVNLRPVSPTQFASTDNLNNQVVDVEIIRSGYANELTASAGSITTYGVPEQAVATGDVFGQMISGTPGLQRQTFLNILNPALPVAGTTTLTAAHLLSMGIKLKDYNTGDCGGVDLTVSRNGLGQAVITTMTPPGGEPCSTTLFGPPTLGSLRLDNQGHLVYYASPTTCCPQTIPCVIFCPTESNPSSAMNVIAAEARTFDHVSRYDSADAIPYPTDGNQFEQGIRGHWRPASEYVYKTSITQGSGRTGATQRNYKRAGIFNDFKLFNWQFASANDPVKWRPQRTVTQYSPDGELEEVRDAAGIYSAERATFNRTTPLMSASNARYRSIAFEDFEWTGNDMVVAHTGSRSLRITSSVSLSPFIHVKATSQILAKGLSLRFWLKVANHDITQAPPPPSGGRGVTIYLNSSTGYFQNVTVGTSSKIAQSGEWTLYEIVPTLFSVPADTLINVGITTTLSASDPPDTVWIDDVRMQPLDAVATTTVVDRPARRMMATLDAEHFATYNQYNPEGTLLRQRAETHRGIRTVAEQYRHMTSMLRYNDEMADGGGGGGGARTRGSGSRARAYISGERPANSQMNGSRIDVLDAEIGADGVKTRLFGDRVWHPLDLEKLAALKLDSIGLPELPVAEKLRQLKRLDELDARRDELERQTAAAADSTERAAAMAALDELGAQRRELLRAVGIDEEQWNEIRAEAAEAKDGVEQEQDNEK